jgi:hypothetical protein
MSHPRGQGAWRYQTWRPPMVTVAPSALLPCAVPLLSRRVQSSAAWTLLLQQPIAVASDYATGFCTWQALLQRHGLHHCSNMQCQQSGDALCPMRAWGGGANCDTFVSMQFLGTCQRCPRGAQGALHHGVGCLASRSAEEDFSTFTLLLRPQRHRQMSARRRHLSAIVHAGDHAAAIAPGDASFVDGQHT